MKLQKPALPKGPVPATFQDWMRKHFSNPSNVPISYVTEFKHRRSAPNLWP